MARARQLGIRFPLAKNRSRPGVLRSTEIKIALPLRIGPEINGMPISAISFTLVTVTVKVCAVSNDEESRALIITT